MPDQGAITTTPRETARQIARYSIDRDIHPDDNGDFVDYEDHAAVVASLTADLAQAQQDHNVEVDKCVALRDALFEAEQARDEAHNRAIVAEESLRMMTENAKSLQLARHSAARTALLEAAERAGGAFQDQNVAAAVAVWLTAIAMEHP